MPFGPGQMTPAVKMLIIVNVATFLINVIVPAMTLRLGLVPSAVLGELALWQPVTYMFLHDTGGLGHLLINMLALWMFGTELERTWGTRFFVKSTTSSVVSAPLSRQSRCRFFPSRSPTRFTTGDGRRVGRDLWTAARLWSLFSEPADLPLLHFPDPREAFRDDRRRHRLLLVTRRSRRRHRAFRSPGWFGRRLRVSQRPSRAPARRAEVSMAAMAHEPRAQPI